MIIYNYYNKFAYYFKEVAKNQNIIDALGAIAFVGLVYYNRNIFLPEKIVRPTVFHKETQTGSTSSPLPLQDDRIIQRESEFARLKEAIEAPIVRFISVTGERECGKTTLINQVVAELQNEGYVYYDAAQLENQTNRKSEINHIQSLNQKFPGKVILSVHIDTNWIGSFCGFLNQAIPSGATCLFETKSDAKEKPSDFICCTNIAVPPLTTSQNYEILRKSDRYFQKTCGASVSEKVIEECFSTIPECKKLRLNDLYSIFSRACLRAKKEGMDALNSETVRTIYAEDRNADTSQKPSFLIKVEGASDPLARDEERMHVLNNIAFRNVLLVGQSILVIDSLFRSVALDIAQKKIPEFSEIYSISAAAFKSEINRDEKLRSFVNKSNTRIILCFNEIGDIPSWNLDEVLKVRCLGGTTLNMTHKKFHSINLPPCEGYLTKIYLRSKKRALEESHKITIPDDTLDLIVHESKNHQGSFPEKALSLLKVAINNSNGDTELKREHVQEDMVL